MDSKINETEQLLRDSGVAYVLGYSTEYGSAAVSNGELSDIRSCIVAVVAKVAEDIARSHSEALAKHILDEDFRLALEMAFENDDKCEVSIDVL